MANEFDPDLPSNKLIFDVRRDNALWPTFLGVHPYFLPQVTRLVHGSAGNDSRSAAAQAYRKSFGATIVE
jgi:hypothetical protein